MASPARKVNLLHPDKSNGMYEIEINLKILKIQVFTNSIATIRVAVA